MFSPKRFVFKLFIVLINASLMMSALPGFRIYRSADARSPSSNEVIEEKNRVIPYQAQSMIEAWSRSTLLAAGDENWDAAFGVPGMDSSVYAIAVGADGYLYAGGTFTSAGGVPVNYIARWDGSTWSELDGGMNNSVWALAVDSTGDLYAAGDFTTAGGISANRVARWDGTVWHSLASGTSGPVSALIFDHNDQLYAGGSFNTAGGVAAERIAKWDGNQWYPLGSGMNNPVRSLTIDSNGELYAGGVFSIAGGVSANRIAHWDGTQWHALGSGLNNTAWAMQFDESGDLYVGGGFTTAGGNPASRIARWDGSSWYAVGGGVDNIVRALVLDGDGRLSVGGDFVTAGGTTFNHIARWDGSTWLALGSGTDAPVRALAPNAGGDLYVGGDFTAAGDKSANYIAWWHRSYYPPVADDDNYITAEDTPLVQTAPGVLSNDTDADGNLLTALPGSGPGVGELSLNLDGSFVYTPTLDFFGFTTFTYMASDGFYTDTATVTITVTPVNDPITAVSDAYTTTEDTELNVSSPGVLANDLDPDGDLLGASVNTQPSHGILSFNVDGSFSYTPAENYHGLDGFSYDVTDGVFTSTASVTLTVTSVNDPPVAYGDSTSTDQDTPVATGDVLANDTDAEGDDLSVDSYDDSATLGLVTYNGNGTFNYDPNGTYNWLAQGEQAFDTFSYTAADGQGGFDTGTVTITVTGLNDIPTAQDDSYIIDEDVSLIVPAPGVLGNDSDVDGDTLNATALVEPAHGSLLLNADGSFTFIPDANYFGLDSFTYEVSDGALTGTALVSLTINPVNDPPEAIDDAYETDEDTSLVVPAPGVLENDSDMESDPLSAVLVQPPMNGSLTLNQDGSFTYTPATNYDGTDSFTYYADDGVDASSAATVTLTINPVNDPPAATDDSYVTDEDIPLVVTAPGVLSNDSDVDGDLLTAMLVSGPSHGTLTLNADGSFTYTPGTNFFGMDGFTYRASDGSLESGSTSVSITVNPINDAPLVEAGEDQDAEEGQLVSFSGSFTDPGYLQRGITEETLYWEFGDGDTASGTLTPSHTYTDDGVYTATLTVTDDLGGSNSDWLLVTVSNVAPSLHAPEDRAIIAGNILEVTISFDDPGLADQHSLNILWGDGWEDIYELDLGLRGYQVTHIYHNPGSYLVAVTVTDDDGGVDSLEFSVTAEPSTYNFHLPVVFHHH